MCSYNSDQGMMQVTAYHRVIASLFALRSCISIIPSWEQSHSSDLCHRRRTTLLSSLPTVASVTIIIIIITLAWSYSSHSNPFTCIRRLRCFYARFLEWWNWMGENVTCWSASVGWVWSCGGCARGEWRGIRVSDVDPSDIGLCILLVVFSICSLSIPKCHMNDYCR